MKAEEREIRRKERILDHAVDSGNVAETSATLVFPGLHCTVGGTSI